MTKKKRSERNQTLEPVSYTIVPTVSVKAPWYTPKKILGLAVAFSVVAIRWLWPSEEAPIEQPCNSADISAMFYRPGSAIAYANIASLPYSFLDEITQGYEDPTHQENYKQAMLWLEKQPNIDTYSPSKFLSFIKKVHSLIEPESHFNPPTGYMYILSNRHIHLVREGNVSPKSLNNLLKPSDYEVLKGLHKKIQYMQSQVEMPQGVAIGNLQETLLLDCYMEKLPDGMHKPKPLTLPEKNLIERFYTFKPQISDFKLQEELQKILSLYKTDPKEAAAQLHMLWISKHQGSDGNGRTARALANHLLMKAGLKPIFFPSRSVYDVAVKDADQNYSSFLQDMTEASDLIGDQPYQMCQEVQAKKCNDIFNYDACFSFFKNKQAEARKEEQYKKYVAPKSRMAHG